MNPLDSLTPDELSSLADLTDVEYQDQIRRHARTKTSEVLGVIQDVMHNSDDDQARLLAANKYLKLAKAEEEDKLAALPITVSPEVMMAALAGLGQLASIARDTTSTQVLKNVTPAKADPRPQPLLDDSPFNASKPMSRGPIDDYEIPGADIIEENLNVQDSEED